MTLNGLLCADVPLRICLLTLLTEQQVKLYVLLSRTYTSIGKLSTDGEHVLSMVDGHLTLTYQGGDSCGSGHGRRTIITFLCDEHAPVIVLTAVCFSDIGIFRHDNMWSN